MRRGWAVPVAALLAGTLLAGCGTGPQPDELTALPSTLVPTISATPTPAPTPTVTAAPSPSSARATAKKVAPSATRSLARPQPAGRSWAAYVTFYGAGDNDPPGSATIAHPNARHGEAGGTGTFANPVTLATDPRELAVGTVVYYPPLQKYFVMEDDCASCIDEWGSSERPHIDLWAGDYSGDDFLACQNTLTPDGRITVEVNPPPGRAVDTNPLYGPSGCAR